MTLDLLPYGLLVAAAGLSVFGPLRLSLVAILMALITGYSLGKIDLIAVPLLILTGALVWWPGARFARTAPRGLLVWMSYGLFLAMAILLSNHLLPGFHNLRVYDHVQFAADSSPFTMYLNFDKVAVGIFICLFFLRSSEKKFRRPQARPVFQHLAALVGVLLVVALTLRYVRADLKWPASGWIWALNNLFLVCLAEEALFRGFIQGGLQRALPKTPAYGWLALVIASILFGLAHYQGGINAVGFAIIAGFFYGHTYWKTDRIQAPILVHFGLNLVHFVAFSYPALAQL